MVGAKKLLPLPIMLLLVPVLACAMAMSLQWEHDGQMINGFEVYRFRPAKGEGYDAMNPYANVSTVSMDRRGMVFTGLSSSHTYYFKVRAFKFYSAYGVGNYRNRSEWSNTANINAPTTKQRGKISGSITNQ